MLDINTEITYINEHGEPSQALKNYIGTKVCSPSIEAAADTQSALPNYCRIYNAVNSVGQKMLKSMCGSVDQVSKRLVSITFASPQQAIQPDKYSVYHQWLDAQTFHIYRSKTQHCLIKKGTFFEDLDWETARDNLPAILARRCNDATSVGISNREADSFFSEYLSEKQNLIDPILDWLRSLPRWAGRDRISDLMYVFQDTSHLSYIMVKKWLIQCVALSDNDGTRPSYGVLVLQGEQGTGKTSTLRGLVPTKLWSQGGFKDGMHIDNITSRDTIMTATSSWITELGEIDSTFKKGQQELRAFITTTSDRYRIPYGHEPQYFPRRTSFCATVNGQQFLRDPEGNRRFWVLQIQEPRYSNAMIQRFHEKFGDPQDPYRDETAICQLWAQAIYYFQSGEQYYLTPQEVEESERRNADLTVTALWQAEIESCYSWDAPLNQWMWQTEMQIKAATKDTIRDVESKGIKTITPALRACIQQCHPELSEKKYHTKRRTAGGQYMMWLLPPASVIATNTGMVPMTSSLLATPIQPTYLQTALPFAETNDPFPS